MSMIKQNVPERPDEKKKVDPDNFNPFRAVEFVNPGLIQWEQRIGLTSNIVRYVFWRIVMAMRGGYDFDDNEAQIAKKLGVPFNTVHSAMKSTLFGRTGKCGQWKYRNWFLVCPVGGACKGKDCDLKPGQKCPVFDLTEPRSNLVTTQVENDLGTQVKSRRNPGHFSGSYTNKVFKGSNRKAPKGGGVAGHHHKAEASPSKADIKTGLENILNLAYEARAPFSDEVITVTWHMLNAFRKLASECLVKASGGELWDYSADDILVHLAPAVQAAIDAGISIQSVFRTLIIGWIEVQISQAKIDGKPARDYLRASLLKARLLAWIKDWKIYGVPDDAVPPTFVEPNDTPEAPPEETAEAPPEVTAENPPATPPEATKAPPLAEDEPKAAEGTEGLTDGCNSDPIQEWEVNGTRPMSLF